LGEYVAQMERGLQTIAIVGTVVVLFVLLILYRRMFARLAQLMGIDMSDGANGTQV